MIGFVYILTNEYFAADVYKVGCTERAPHARAEELSKGTAIPAPFQVLCFIEIDGFQQVEKQLHDYLQGYRISTNREFFDGGLEDAIAWMWWKKGSLGFHGVGTATPYVANSFIQYLVEREIVSPPNAQSERWSMHDLPNPWEPNVPATTGGFDSITGDMPWETPTHAAPEPVLKVVGGTEL